MACIFSLGGRIGFNPTFLTTLLTAVLCEGDATLALFGRRSCKKLKESPANSQLLSSLEIALLIIITTLITILLS